MFKIIKKFSVKGYDAATTEPVEFQDKSVT
jgi:hypothetical protein